MPGVVVSGQLLAAVGNPQEGLAFVHIAGTNGKGSTAAFLRSVLKEAGIRAGLFTSPHLIDFAERIQVDGRKIPKEDVVRLGARALAAGRGLEPTMFDLCLAMALLHFKEQGCQLAVLETGLGGRLDATNAVGTPLVGVITRIGYDHMAVLGNTLEEIAAEKAGILKRGMRAVIGSQAPKVKEALEGRCRELSIPCQTVDASRIAPMAGGFSYPGEGFYQLKMLGSYQRENALAAILCARELMELGYPIAEEALRRGIAGASWDGRMELICESPFLLIDGAHNEDGALALTESLKELYPGEKFHFIMGVLAEKDYKKMARLIAPLAKKVTAVTPESERALQGKELSEYIRSLGVKTEQKDCIEEALAPFLFHAPEKEAYGSGERTALFGSLYFVGEARRLFVERERGQ